MLATIFTKGKKAFYLGPKIIDILTKNDISIIDSEMMPWDQKLIADHYKNIIHKDFYPDVQKMLCSHPSLFLLVEGDLERILKTVGEKTYSKNCNEDSIRFQAGQQYGHDLTWNTCHRTGTEKDSIEEYNRFWGPEGAITKYRHNPKRRFFLIQQIIWYK